MMDIYAMREHRRLTVLLGIGFAAAMVAVVILVIAKFDGVFSGDVDMTARLPEDAAVVAVNSPVHYRDVKVGKVTSAPHPDGQGHIVVDLEIDPDRVPEIPGTVAAGVAPVSIFGNQYVNLIPGQAPSSPLRAGSVIPAIAESGSPSLQSTFAKLDRVLEAIHPAQLNAGLSGLAQALAGRGRSLGKTLVSADTYLTQMVKLWPKLVADLKDFAPFATTLAASTPAFLDLMRTATVTSDTFAEHGSDFAELMAKGGAAAHLTGKLIDQTMGTYADTISGANALFPALSQGPRLISRMLAGLSSMGRTWSQALAGPTVGVQARLKVINPAALGLASVSGKDVGALLEQAVAGSVVNPPTYTSADRPSYRTPSSHTSSRGGRR